MRYLLGIFFVLIISQVCAVCEDRQIDINSASLTKLDELSGIGEILAGRIIEMRPFDSIDDLIEVERIGEITLQKIKEQGLACVNEEKEQDNPINEEDTTNIESNFVVPDIITQTETISNQENNIKPEIITLNSPTKDIKSEDDEGILDKSDYAKYGFIGFCVLLGFLFILKKRKVRNKFD